MLQLSDIGSLCPDVSVRRRLEMSTWLELNIVSWNLAGVNKKELNLISENFRDDLKIHYDIFSSRR